MMIIVKKEWKFLIWEVPDYNYANEDRWEWCKQVIPLIDEIVSVTKIKIERIGFRLEYGPEITVQKTVSYDHFIISPNSFIVFTDSLEFRVFQKREDMGKFVSGGKNDKFDIVYQQGIEWLDTNG